MSFFICTYAKHLVLLFERNGESGDDSKQHLKNISDTAVPGVSIAVHLTIE